MKKENHIENRIEQLIREERNTELNPYLSTRVMAAIAKQQDQKTALLPMFLKPVLAMASLTIVVWLGIIAGSEYTTVSTEQATILTNDAAAENFAFYLQTEKED
jgi:hypothetical protein